MTQNLRAQKIVQTIDVLQARISERFPESGLAGVCSELLATAKKTDRRARAIGRPNLATWFFFVFFGAVVVYLFGQVIDGSLPWAEMELDGDALSLTQAIESFFNLMILFVGGLFFLSRLEARGKRQRALNYLHELRSIAHVVDMHQLTKDPTAILNESKRTASSPARNMSEFELSRYLDYCTEMLALTGKLAALYGERIQDAEIVNAVNDIETLTTGLGTKIWQKIMIITGSEIENELSGLES